jgi:hypothetical protein
MTDSTASVMESTITFMEGAGVNIFYLRLVRYSGEVPVRSLTNFYSGLLTIA